MDDLDKLIAMFMILASLLVGQGVDPVELLEGTPSPTATVAPSATVTIAPSPTSVPTAAPTFTPTLPPVLAYTPTIEVACLRVGTTRVTLNIRNAPSVAGTRIGQYAPGSQVIFYEGSYVEAGGYTWVQLAWDDGLWVALKFGNVDYVDVQPVDADWLAGCP